MIRIIAVLMLVIPGIIAAYGIKLMRDALFYVSDFGSLPIGLQFFIGFIFFVCGLAFIGGFIVHRDRKRQVPKKKQND